jgi:hypothetical protein
MGPRNTSSYFTPLNDFQENCEHTLVVQVYSGESTTPEVTELLGMSPNSSFTSGERIATKDPGEFRVGTCWFLSSELVESRDLRRHLAWLPDKVEPGSDS